MSASKHTLHGAGVKRGTESIKADQQRARYLDTWLREMDRCEIKLVNAQQELFQLLQRQDDSSSQNQETVD